MKYLRKTGRLLMRISPVCLVHHISLGWGWVKLPFPWHKRVWMYCEGMKSTVEGFDKGKYIITPGWRRIENKNFHNSSWSGVY